MSVDAADAFFEGDVFGFGDEELGDSFAKVGIFSRFAGDVQYE